MKSFFIFFSLVIGFLAFVPYFIGLWKKQLHPHLLSFLTWGILTALGFFVSFHEGGGQGSWLLGMDTFLCLSIAGIVFFQKEKNIARIDWIFFIGAILILIFYFLTQNPVLSVILAAIIDFLGFLPTFRKDYLRPYDDPPLNGLLSSLSFLLSFGALGIYSFLTLFYPLTLMVTNLFFAIFLLVRRRAISK